MRFAAQPPPPGVAEAVGELWLLADDGALHTGLPKPWVEIVINLGGVHWWRDTPTGPEHRYVDAWVTPLQHAPRQARSDGPRLLMGARLQPWAARALFGPLPPGDGRPPPLLGDLIGTVAARALQDDVRSDANDLARFARFGEWLMSQRALRRQAGPAMASADGRAASLAAAQATTPRTLRRRISSLTGLAPKRWLMLTRVDAVLRDPALGQAEVPLAALAHDHGYADQPHLTRELVRMTGATPARLRRRPRGGPPHLLTSE